MPLTDPIGDFITRMRNAQHGRHTDCRVAWSVIKEGICKVMKTNEFLADVQVEGEGPAKELIAVFRSDRPALILERISTPGSRKYVGHDEIRGFLHGSSIAILSTSNGLLTDKEARAKKVGGEILCTVS